MSIDETTETAQPVRDNRGKNWFWADHDIMDVYGSHIGVYGISVYMYLARRVDDATQRCWPSYQTIANALNISRPKAIEAVQDLEACGLLSIEAREIEGHRSSNYFTLQPRENWIAPENIALPSRAKKTKKQSTLSASGRGKQDLPHNKQDLPPGKRRGKQDLPKQETSNQETMNKNQHASAADSSNPALLNGATAPDERATPDERTDAIAQRLVQLRLTPSAAAMLARQYPERCETAVAYWSARGFDGKRSPAGTLRASIEQGPDKWPDVYAPVEPAPSRSTLPPLRRPPDTLLDEAAQVAFNELTPADQKYIARCVELEESTLRVVMEDQRNSEFHAALKRLQKQRTAPTS